MSKNNIIPFLIYQLKNNEQDRKNYNELFLELNFGQDYKGRWGFGQSEELRYYGERFIANSFLDLNKGGQVGVISIILETAQIFKKHKSLIANSFNHRILDGCSFNKSIQSLHEKMLELIPEYVEFCKDNK